MLGSTPPVPFELTASQVRERLEWALQKLRTRDQVLFEHNASERSMCFRLGLYLQENFEEFNVDCEYNRHGSIPKRLEGEAFREAVKSLAANGLSEPDPRWAITVLPDIIVHCRGNDCRNLLIIEAKKQTNPVSRDYDLIKLEGYQRELLYKFAAFIEFGIRAGTPFTTIEKFYNAKLP